MWHLDSGPGCAFLLEIAHELWCSLTICMLKYRVSYIMSRYGLQRGMMHFLKLKTQNSKASFIKCTLGSLLWHPSKSRHYTILARHHPMYQNQASTTKAIPKNVFISWLTNKNQALYKGRLANWIYSTYHLLLNKYHLFSKC